MTRLTAPAGMAAILVASSAVAATGESGTTTLASTTAVAGNGAALAARAERPSYDDGGWRCPPGFVWRQAGRTDWLCVDAVEAQRIARENERAADLWIRRPDGSRDCRAGLVPRDAFKGDPVCVDPLRRDSVRSMNAALYTVR